MIRLFNDPNLFGRVPDPPEPPECPERFIESECEWCSDFDKCKAEYERMCGDDDE